jgi:rfaE bifunctional protein kinase chain/domain
VIHISKKRIHHLFDSFSDCRLMVIGDLMLDRYIWGKVSRISPEAPVPVVEVESETNHFGGAANVAMNVAALGASVFSVGVIGQDASGETLKALFQKNGFDKQGVIVDPDRPTTVKTRIIADCQHVVRTDREHTAPVKEAVANQVMQLLHERGTEFQGIILEDYEKGLFSPALIRQIIHYANSHDLMTFVDPKYAHFFEYQHVTLFKPNRKEVSACLSNPLKTESDLINAAEQLFARLSCQAVLITLGEQGMMLFEPGKSVRHVPTRAVKVHDVSGAGDTVISVMAVAMASGASLPEAATLANHAAGIVCGEVGIVPIERKILFDVMLEEAGID